MDGEQQVQQQEQARWYVLQVMSGQENRVYNLLKNEMDYDHAPAIEDLQIPVDKIEKRGKDGKVKVKDGKVEVIERKRYPGYILIKVRLLDKDGRVIPEVWQQVKSIQGVIGFLGDSRNSQKPSKPSELPEEEVVMMLKGNGEAERPRPRIQFKIGEKVLLKGSAFMGYEGVVENIDEERARLKVSVNMFGRSTPIEIGIDEVERP